ncbi:MAG: PqqD family protein [Prevotella sp.]|jgi:predicted transcriptional regulator|nr:PqqD family protein [Prevotella sp.]
MRIKKGFNLRAVCGENIIVAEGLSNIDFSRIISLNESAVYLWKNIQGKDFNQEMLADLLMQEYEVEKDTALRDAEMLIGQWKEAGLIEE